jgi:sulfur-oxidizing protein SoxY
MSDDRTLDRRSFLRTGAFTVAALSLRGRLHPDELDRSTVRDAVGPDDEMTDAVRKVLHDHFGTRSIRVGHMSLDVPSDAPDGRAVPVFLESDLAMTPDSYVKALHLIVDHNPDIYLAGFEFTPAIGAASIDTRIKMRRTTWVRGIAETNTGELWSAAKKVYVGLNGCG